MAFKFYIPIEKTIKIKPQQIYNYSLRFYCLNLYAIIYRIKINGYCINDSRLAPEFIL